MGRGRIPRIFRSGTILGQWIICGDVSGVTSFGDVRCTLCGLTRRIKIARVAYAEFCRVKCKCSREGTEPKGPREPRRARNLKKKEVKLCCACGEKFGMPPGMHGGKKWEKKIFCSAKCAKIKLKYKVFGIVMDIEQLGRLSGVTQSCIRKRIFVSGILPGSEIPSSLLSIRALAEVK